MPVDPQTRAILEYRATLPPMRTVPVAELRAQLEAPPPPGLRIAAVASAADRTVPGPGGPECRQGCRSRPGNWIRSAPLIFGTLSRLLGARR